MAGLLPKLRLAEPRALAGEPGFSGAEAAERGWSKPARGGAREAAPAGAPEPLGKPVAATSRQGASPRRGAAAGRPAAAALHFPSKLPVDWRSKKQAAVEAAARGSERASARACAGQVAGLRAASRRLGAPARGASRALGDNEPVAASSTQPRSRLHKRRGALPCRRTREATAPGRAALTRLPKKLSPASMQKAPLGSFAKR